MERSDVVVVIECLVLLGLLTWGDDPDALVHSVHEMVQEQLR